MYSFVVLVGIFNSFFFDYLIFERFSRFFFLFSIVLLPLSVSEPTYNFQFQRNILLNAHMIFLLLILHNRMHKNITNSSIYEIKIDSIPYKKIEKFD